MKVAVVSIHPLNDNRITRHLTTLVNAKQYDVDYINVSNSTGFPVDGVKLIHEDIQFSTHNIISVIKTWKFIRNRLLEKKYDVVHCHDLYLLPPVVITKAKYIVFDRHERFEIINSFLAKLFCMYEKKNISKIDAAVYTVENEKDFLLNIGYKNIAYIPNYQSKKSFCLAESMEEDKIKLLYIGSLSNYDRNIDLLLKIYEFALEHSPSVYCVLGGKTEDQSINEKISYLSTLYPDRFNYIGYCSHERVIRETVNADISFLLFRDFPNTRNSSPNKLYECLLGGCAFVGLGQFIIGKEIAEVNAGLIFDFSASEDTVVNAVIRLIDNKDEILRMKKSAKIIGQQYTWESIEERYIELYNRATIVYS